MNTAMASELNVLSHMFDRIGESNRKSRDFTLESLRSVIIEVVACFPVYRTYVDERGASAEEMRAVTAVAKDLARKGRSYTELDGRFAGQVVVRGTTGRGPGA